jgi:acetyl esterase/lipase
MAGRRPAYRCPVGSLLRGWATLVGLAGGLTLAGPRAGRVAVALWLPRLMAQAWAPVLAASGLVVGAAALAAGRSATGLVALGGAWLSTRFAVDAVGQPLRLWPVVLPAPPAARCLRDVVVDRPAGNRPPLLGDLWLPTDGTAPSGVGVVYLHGGLWQALDKGFLVAPLMRAMAARGHVVLDIAYPLAPGATLEDMERAIRAATHWLRSAGAVHGVRPDRIVLVGHAGGGHLALVTAFREARAQAAGVPQLRGVVAISAVTDPAAFWNEYGRVNPRQPGACGPISDDLRPRLRDTAPLDRLVTKLRLLPAYRYGNMPGGAMLVHDLFGGPPRNAPDRYATWSPLELAGPACPPVLQVTGGDDAIVLPSHGRRLHQRLQEAGVPSVLEEVPHAVHAFDQYPGVSRRLAPAARRTTAHVIAFLDERR